MALLQTISFNCNGVFSSINDIIDLFEDKDDCVMFLSEHWLQNHELNDINTVFRNEGYWSYLKSSVDPEEELHGRPYGGVGFVCKRPPTSSYSLRPKIVDNDRIAVIQLIDHGKILLNIIGVYLPYFNGKPEQSALYAETLEVLQSVIDSCDTPIMLMGDMNAPLPQEKSLPLHWYRRRPFNHNSFQLYDFMTENELCVANFAFPQEVNYTYRKGTHKTYIDHVLVPKFLLQNIVSCKIAGYDDIPSSDHLPIVTTMELPMRTSISNQTEVNEPATQLVKLDWDNKELCKMFQESLSSSLAHSNSIPNPKSIQNSNDAQTAVDNCCTEIVCAIHKSTTATAEAFCTGTAKKRRQPWWSQECTILRDRTMFWRSIWIQCGRCRHSQVFQCYKKAKSQYRLARRHALNTSQSLKTTVLKNLFKYGHTKKFWNKVKMLKNNGNDNRDSIEISALTSFFKERFSEKPNDSLDPKFTDTVNAKINSKQIFNPISLMVSDSKIKNCIKRLKPHRAAGHDGIQPEHLKNSLQTPIPAMICKMFTICGMFGVIPSSFHLGILSPILKKQTLDPAVAKNYRPIIVSTTLSKLLEYIILDCVSDHKFHKSQYGFIHQRSTNMAISLASDVIKYTTSRGSSVFACTLDAEMAFDGIPHSVLLYKAIDIIPDPWWFVMYAWYKHVKVRVKWKNMMSECFNLEKGTRQGGLTSPFLFNLFYQELVMGLSNTTGGLRINGRPYNVIAYADDLLLLSATASGLQCLLDYASDYVTKHGLRFNSDKTFCITFGKQYLTPSPKWYLQNDLLKCEESIQYLGAVLSNSTVAHKEKRIKSCRNGFFKLQCAGLHRNGAKPNIVSYLWKTAIQPILTYANECQPLRLHELLEMDKLQAKLVKSSLGLSKYLRSSPLLNALNISTILRTCEKNAMNLLKSILYGSSSCKDFYFYLWSSPSQKAKCDTLLSRNMNYCVKYNISLVKYVLDDQFTKQCHKLFKPVTVDDGLVDSLRMLFTNFDENDQNLTKLLLSAF